ncbi:deoxynucleoside 5'-monophosphate N-glycosidase [Methanolobus psychrophilus R15]|nr:deoxynucleoside 5'-monophosphate N-glycosidase [Methanolobus psychrophilus R15]
MRIFLSASIRGGRDMLHVYTEILELLQCYGHEVLSWHVADPELEDKEFLMTEQGIYERDMGLLVRSECMIAEVSTPSIGVGYEICRALQLGLPTLCLHSPHSRVSAMILGNKNNRIICRQYANYQELEKNIGHFLATI